MKTFLFLITLVLTIGTNAQRYRVVISEIMADPTPSVGLPEYEWIEIYNRSSESVSLDGWRIGDASSQSGSMPAFTLEPGAYVLVAGSTTSTHLSAISYCLPVSSWPALDNVSELVVLYDNTGQIVHAVHYNSDLFSSLKKDGGWTLEMQKTEYPCLQNVNWKESAGDIGGSPGTAPARPGQIDLHPLYVQYATPVNENEIILSWSDAPDSGTATQKENYTILNGPAVVAVELLPPLFTQAKLKLGGNMEEHVVYTTIVRNISNCTGSPFASDSVQIGLPQRCEPGDVIINEILFNPYPDGFDYLEIYNSGLKLIDAATIRIASRNSNGQVQSPVAVSTRPDLFFPGQYRVVCVDTAWLTRQYKDAVEGNKRQLPSFPSYPDKEGTAVLLNSFNEVVDEFSYNEKLHFPLLPTTEGVSLERRNAQSLTNVPGSWHSAAGVTNGTPGYKNSQHIDAISSSGNGQNFRVSSRRLSPNNDGMEDRLVIEYNMPAPGVMAGIRVFDARGHPVRILERNVLLGMSGQFIWDGLDEQKRPQLPGIFIIWAEWFDLNGKRKMWKEGVILQ